MTTKTPAQLAYDEDVAKRPTYSDGSPRRTWDQIGRIAQSTWEPRPQEAAQHDPAECAISSEQS